MGTFLTCTDIQPIEKPGECSQTFLGVYSQASYSKIKLCCLQIRQLNPIKTNKKKESGYVCLFFEVLFARILDIRLSLLSELVSKSVVITQRFLSVFSLFELVHVSFLI